MLTAWLRLNDSCSLPMGMLQTALHSLISSGRRPSTSRPNTRATRFVTGLHCFWMSKSSSTSAVTLLKLSDCPADKSNRFEITLGQQDIRRPNFSQHGLRTFSWTLKQQQSPHITCTASVSTPCLLGNGILAQRVDSHESYADSRLLSNDGPWQVIQPSCGLFCPSSWPHGQADAIFEEQSSWAI